MQLDILTPRLLRESNVLEKEKKVKIKKPVEKHLNLHGCKGNFIFISLSFCPEAWGRFFIVSEMQERPSD